MNSALTPLQRAFLALQEVEARADALEADANAPIAIIGLGCRAPGGVHDAATFWRLLSEGRDVVGPVPKNRWDHEAFYDSDPEVPGKIAATAAGFCDHVDEFDAAFFGLSPREADGMDPQQRMLLEVCWETLENAGLAPDRLHSSPTGVYVGCAGSDYAYMQMKSGGERSFDAHFASGIAHSVLSGRVSYLLGLQGPSLTIDTACSSSLVAIHLACQALRARECRLALAGGVNLILSPEIFIALSHARMLAPDGRCKAFDAAADGFGRGEGCAMLALKRLADAEADGDRVLAIVRGSAVNQDGPSSSLTAPNGPAQEAVIRAALAKAGIAPHLVGYVEAHGTGTQLGDPLEAQALGAVFSGGRPADRPLLVGSVKSNIGHLEAAAGAIGLVKTVLALQHAQIPASLHVKTPSPHVAWRDIGLCVAARAQPWPEIEGRRIGAVSSFGFSGTNAHVVVEAAPLPRCSRNDGRAVLAPLSAHRPESLRELAASHRDALMDDMRVSDVARTLTLGRAHRTHRAVVRAQSIVDLRAGFDALARGDQTPGLSSAMIERRDPPRIAFLFTGQGAQYAGMAARLYANAPAFREAFDRCDEILAPLLGSSLRELVIESKDTKALEQTALAQPALFAVEYSLASFLRALGVSPVAVLGHSVGEYVAACVAGALHLSDALRLIAARGALMQSLPKGGAMAAVFAPEARVVEAIAPYAREVSIAAINGPAQTVISGTAAAVASICDALAAKDVKSHPLAVSHAFHSPLVEPILDRLEAVAAKATFKTPRTHIISNVTGRRIEPGLLASPRYWRRHAREAVRFADGLSELARMKVDICVELGPHPALGAFAATVFEDGGPRVLPTLRRDVDDWIATLDMVAALFLEGTEIDWHALDPENVGRPVSLPGPAFQRQRHWFQAPAAVCGAGSDVGHPLLGRRLWSPLREVVQFEALIEPQTAAFIADHVVRDRIIMPAAGMIEMGLSAGRLVSGGTVEIENFVIAESLAFTDSVPRAVQTVVRIADGRAQSFEVSSRPAGGENEEWTLHAQGDFTSTSAQHPAPPTLDGARVTAVSVHYDDLARRGVCLGPGLRVVQSIRAADSVAAGVIAAPAGGGYGMHPAVLDGCLQVIAAALPQDESVPYLPLAIDRIRFARTASGITTAYVAVRDRRLDVIKADVVLHDENGELGVLEGVTLRALRTPAAADFYEVAWRETDAASVADWGLSPEALDEALGAHLPALARMHDLDRYHQSFLALESMSVQWIAQMFARLGWRPNAGERTTAAALAKRLAVKPRYQGALARYLDILAEDGLLRVDGEDFIVVSRLPAIPPQHDAFVGEPRGQLAAACCGDLAGILTGQVDPLHRLFPDGSSTLAEALYRDSAEARTYNQLLAEAVAAIVARAPAGRKVRILEVGGGTGGSTYHIVSMLKDAPVAYCFTDIGQSMVERARQAFVAHGFMSFRRFDIEGDAGAQGFEPESFDIIIAANVVHATADLRRTLGQLNGLLAPGGALFLLEVTGFERWIDLTFGLTEGWWRFTDRDLRPRYPLLSREQWRAVLESCGFAAGEIGRPLAASREALLVGRKQLARAPRRWALLGEGAGLAAQMQTHLTALGHDAQSVPASEACGSFDDIVCFSFLDIAGSAQQPLADQRSAIEPILAAVRCMGTADRSQRLWIVTRGAVAAGPTDVADAAQATALGVRRAAALEHPDWHPTLIDLDANTAPEAQANALAAQLLSNCAEAERALRAGRVLVSRLTRLPQDSAKPVRLEAGGAGVLEGLRLTPASRRPPGPGEIEIRVSASGLNFRDVMNALAMRSDGEPLGGECAGIVTAVGAGVQGFAVGDVVVATGAGAFATYLTVDADAAAPRPRGLSDAQAAALPLAAMTARHALIEIAKLRPDQSILVHAGAGGLGMAAIAIARRIGAKIFATAGSEMKRNLLRDLGAEHVFSSRNLAFEPEVMRATEGRGVDVVLNSLSGDFIGASVRALASYGVFLEVGKQDIWTRERFCAVRPHARYHPIDLARVRLDEPERWRTLFQSVMADAASGAIDPLPVRVFPLANAADAFAFMAAARHVGKIVLEHPDVAGAGFAGLDPEGVYLVTGAFAGLGLATARRLVERGARNLALLGRSPPGAEAAAQIANWRAAGVEVLILQVDVADRAAMTQALAHIDATGRPLRGVVHSAGALADGALLQQDWPRFEIPLRAKLVGAWTLHELTRERGLDFFILYSSVAGTLGSAGQANHAAANAFMDALAQRRRAEGLPALSIAWGAWSQIGAAANRGADERVASRGVLAYAPAKGLDALEALAAGAPAQVVASPMDWRTYLSEWEGNAPEFYNEILSEHASVFARVASTGRDDAFLQRLESAPRGAHRDMLSDFIALAVARVLGRQGETIDPQQPLNEMGLDSLLAVELRNRLGTALGIGRGLPATLVFDCPTVEALAQYIDGRLRPAREEEAIPEAAGKSQGAIADIDKMSDDEVEATFDRMARA
jgi:acyl transferase domain-containing protein/NADPH:quinone reductase-like Zn-dependent oxidoreductase/NAD(P)-dependent dehydrogenase (short-subunit alcohol dehydrogenase family)/SAM-dependent methyltransferase